MAIAAAEEVARWQQERGLDEEHIVLVAGVGSIGLIMAGLYRRDETTRQAELQSAPAPTAGAAARPASPPVPAVPMPKI